MKNSKRSLFPVMVLLLLLLMPAVSFAEDAQNESQYVPDAPMGGSGSDVQPMYLQQLSDLVERERELDEMQTLQHKVVKGETLGAIASRYDVSLDYLMQVNNLSSPHYLRVGQELTLLSDDPTKDVVSLGANHTLQRGETIWDLSQQYDVSVDEIVAFNHITDPHRLQAGQAIAIPGEADIPAQYPVQRELLVASRSSGASETATTSSNNAGFIWPVQGRITSGYGPRWGSFHNGIDVASPTGAPIKAIAAGTVVTAGWRQGFGYMIRIDHQNGWNSLYAHASQLFVKEGQDVQSGHQIAAVGATGNATGPHVHLEMIYEGAHRNPIQHLPAR